MNEMFTQLPTTASAQMSDIICAVQGYVSSSNLGLSVQETLGQVYSLFQSNLILYNAGNPNGAVAGTTYQLCWDTTDGILYVCTTSGSASSAIWSKSIKLTAGSGISIAQSGSTITISSTPALFAWNAVTTSTEAMASFNGYWVNYSGGLCTLTLPATSSFGDALNVMGSSADGWTIAQGSGQYITIDGATTTTGTMGSVSSITATDSLQLVCTVANTAWQAPVGPEGSLTIV